MTTEALTKAIEDRIQHLEIDLMFLSRPENLSAQDGEFIASKIAQDGLKQLSELQDLVANPDSPQKKTASE